MGYQVELGIARVTAFPIPPEYRWASRVYILTECAPDLYKIANASMVSKRFIVPGFILVLLMIAREEGPVIAAQVGAFYSVLGGFVFLLTRMRIPRVDARKSS